MWDKIKRFLFASVYEVVTWVWIGLSIGDYFYNATNKNARGVRLSEISLAGSVFVVLCFIGKRIFWDDEADKPLAELHSGPMTLDAAPKPSSKIEPPTPVPAKPRRMPKFFGTPPSQIGHPQSPYDNIKWTDYTEDWFYDVIWRWHYKPPSKTPRDVKPFCPECVYPSDMDYRVVFPEKSVYLPYEQKPPYLRLRCAIAHSQVYVAEYIMNMQLDDFRKIRELIEEKLADDSWRQVVIERKKAQDGKYS